MEYKDFVASKAALAVSTGFDPGEDAISDVLLPHQKAIVRWALKGGRRAIFTSYGTGKTLMQLEIMRLIQAHEGGRQLIVCPLGVRQEFKHDASLIGLEPKFAKWTSDVDSDRGLWLCNYESIRDGRLDPNLFNAVSLDEGSVLRSFGSKTYQTFLPLFRDVPYRFVATATPSPNRELELTHYSQYLSQMDSSTLLTRFFQRNSQKANDLTVMESRRKEFYLYLASFAVFMSKPSDLGFSDDGYVLPEMEVRWHRVETPDSNDFQFDRNGQGRLVVDATVGVQDACRARRDSMDVRIAKMKEIVDESPDDHFILWHNLEAERHAIKRAIPEAVELYGSLDIDERERRIVDFAEGRTRILATKPVISGFGCNFQRHCHRAIFADVDFKLEALVQAIHRLQRFQQTEKVIIDIIYADTQEGIVDVLKRKWREYEELTNQMEEIIRKYGLAEKSIADALTKKTETVRVEASGKGWIVANNDTVIETAMMDENSVDLIVTSIPFSNQYAYCDDNYADFGESETNEQFFEQMDYLTPNLLRVLEPGRIMAVHVKDRIEFASKTGKGLPTVYPFHADCIKHYIGHGFDYLGMITVVTDVVRENNQTYRLGWTAQCKDGSHMGVGMPEYILIFHKPQTDRTRGFADVPIVKTKEEYSRARWQVDAHAFWRSDGDRPLTSEEIAALPVGELTKAFTERSAKMVYDYETHIKIGEELEGVGHLPATFMAISPGSWMPDVWADVIRMRTFNTTQAQRGKEQHLCPLPWDIVERLVTRYSNPGDLVYDPFSGLGTVPYIAVKLGRKGRGVELNTQYFLDSVGYLKEQELKMDMPTLFDVEGLN